MYYSTLARPYNEDDEHDSPFDEDIDIISTGSEDTEIVSKSNGFRGFLRGYSVYDVMPDSGKVIIMDPDLSIAQAIGVLVYNEITCLPLWCSRSNSFYGVFTVWDLVDILVETYDTLHSTPTPSSNWYHLVSEHSVRGWKETHPKDNITILPTARLSEALHVLRTKHMHRLPVVDDSGSVLHIISPRRIANFLVGKYRRTDDVSLKKTVHELACAGVGVFDVSRIVTCEMTDLLIDVLRVLKQERIASVVIVEKLPGGIKPVNIFNTADLIGLLFGSSLPSTNLLVKDALKFQLPRREGLHVVKKDVFLKKLLQDSTQYRIHRFICVDEDGFLSGIISLGDVLKSFGE
ncbi:hypothetical protein P9112_003287 [Eukaryota sp. TZLM1-RC]